MGPHTSLDLLISWSCWKALKVILAKVRTRDARLIVIVLAKFFFQAVLKLVVAQCNVKMRGNASTI